MTLTDRRNKERNDYHVPCLVELSDRHDVIRVVVVNATPDGAFIVGFEGTHINPPHAKDVTGKLILENMSLSFLVVRSSAELSSSELWFAVKFFQPNELLLSCLDKGLEKIYSERSVFISYRRQNSVDIARLIRAELSNQGHRVFLDVIDLEPGKIFEEELLKQISIASNFIVILSSECLNRCLDENDWMRKEVSHAIENDKNIIPIMMPDFSFPDIDLLPEDLRTISRYHGLKYSNEYFDAMINSIVQYLK